ncbi:MAG: hypothetical protein ACXWUD_09095 [Methylosarcina sp.]
MRNRFGERRTIVAGVNIEQHTDSKITVYEINALQNIMLEKTELKAGGGYLYVVHI